MDNDFKITESNSYEAQNAKEGTAASGSGLIRVNHRGLARTEIPNREFKYGIYMPSRYPTGSGSDNDEPQRHSQRHNENCE